MTTALQALQLSSSRPPLAVAPCPTRHIWCVEHRTDEGGNVFHRSAETSVDAMFHLGDVAVKAARCDYPDGRAREVSVQVRLPGLPWKASVDFSLAEARKLGLALMVAAGLIESGLSDNDYPEGAE